MPSPPSGRGYAVGGGVIPAHPVVAVFDAALTDEGLFAGHEPVQHQGHSPLLHDGHGFGEDAFAGKMLMQSRQQHLQQPLLQREQR